MKTVRLEMERLALLSVNGAYRDIIAEILTWIFPRKYVTVGASALRRRWNFVIMARCSNLAQLPTKGASSSIRGAG